MAWKNVQSFCKDNAPTIFTVLGVVFTIGAVVETVHATVRTRKELEDAEYEKWEAQGCPEDGNVDISLSKKEVFQIAWPKYIASGVLLGGAITFDILSNRFSKKQLSEVTGACVLLSQALSTTQESIREYLSPKDAARVETGIVHKKIEADKRNPETVKRMEELRSRSETNTIFRDAFGVDGHGCTYLDGTYDQFRKAVSVFNRELESYGKATLNDWYYALSRAGIKIGSSDLGDYLEYNYSLDGPMDLYAVPDTVDTDFANNTVTAIGIRRMDTANVRGNLAYPSTPHKTYGR